MRGGGISLHCWKSSWKNLQAIQDFLLDISLESLSNEINKKNTKKKSFKKVQGRWLVLCLLNWMIVKYLIKLIDHFSAAVKVYHSSSLVAKLKLKIWKSLMEKQNLDKRLLIDIEIKLEKINELVREGLSEKVSVYHITYRYIDSSCHTFEICFPPWFFYQSYLVRYWLIGWLKKPWEKNCGRRQFSK